METVDLLALNPVCAKREKSSHGGKKEGGKKEWVSREARGRGQQSVKAPFRNSATGSFDKR
jgi:hypothetical protein